MDPSKRPLGAWTAFYKFCGIDENNPPPTTPSNQSFLPPRVVKKKTLSPLTSPGSALKHPELLADDPETRNLVHWNRTLQKGFSITKIVQPNKFDAQTTLVRDMFDLAPVRGRAVTFISFQVDLSHQKRIPTCHYLFLDGNVSTKLYTVYGSFGGDEIDNDELTVLGKWLAWLLNRLPLAIPLSSLQVGDLFSYMMYWAVAEAFPDRFETYLEPAPNQVPTVLVTKRPHDFEDKVRCQWKRSYDTDSGSVWRAEVLFPLSSVDLRQTVPDCPLGGGEVEISSENPPDVQDKNDARIKQAARICRHVCYTSSGLIGGKLAMSQFVSRTTQMFLKEIKWTRKMPGPYRGERLTRRYFNIAERDTMVHPPTHVRKDITSSIYVHIIGISKARCLYVEQKMLEAFMYQGMDVLSTYFVGCTYADIINAEGTSGFELAARYCECEDPGTSETLHYCMACFLPYKCQQISVTPQHLFLCGNCFRTEIQEPLVEDVPYPEVAIMRMMKRVDTLIASEQKSHLTVDERHDWEKELERHQHENGLFQDTYSPQVLDTFQPREILTRGRMLDWPFCASVDAALPYMVVDGVVHYHHPANTAVTAVFINFLKWTWLPGILALIGQHLRQRAKPDEQASSAILARFDEVYAIRLRIPLAKSARKALPIPQAEFDDFIKPSFLQMRISPGEMIRTIQLKLPPSITFGWSANSAWRPERYESLERIILEMEARHCYHVPRSRYGAPWFWIPGHMPNDWNWRRLYTLFVSRRLRMRTTCNKKHPTIDDAGTLLLECAWQFLKNKGRDSFLGLPMTVIPKHPLCFAIAHRHHKQQMRTGFNTLSPNSLQDYDERLSNILFETQLSNFSKWAFGEQYYERMQDALSTLFEATEWYVPPIGGNVSLSDTISEQLRNIHYPDDPDSVGAQDYESENDAEEADNDVDTED